MSIKLKFTILILVFIIILVSILTYLSIYRQQSLLLESTDKRIKVIMMNTSDTIKEGIISADDLLISTTIRKIKERNEDIIHTFLVDKRGNLLFHSDSQIMNKVLGMGIKEDFSKSPEMQKAVLSSDFLKQIHQNEALYSYPVTGNNVKMATLFINFSLNRIMQNINQTRTRLITISFVILLIFMAITYVFTSILLRPIKLLTKGAQIIGTGNLDYTIPVKQKDELGNLAFTFNRMSYELKISRQKAIDKELFERDLKIASEIQKFLIPEKIPQIKNILLNAIYKPARFVGGDYYDVVEIGPNKYGVIIVDVSGKGSGAAIIMAVITFIFHSEAPRTFDTSKLMFELNNKLFERIPLGNFATGLYMIYDAEKEIMQYTNAGHSNLILFNKASGKIFELSKASSFPLGISKDTDYTRAAFKFEKGDVILLQTDGIYEAKNVNQQEFSNERVKSTLMKHSSANNPDKLNELIMNEINQFVGAAHQHDDMTLITIKKV
ncbi:MAG: SpoIIE family protein phosphatase [bacterium]|nr:SpoIIE family protein phosphatase [bacterium]